MYSLEIRGNLFIAALLLSSSLPGLLAPQQAAADAYVITLQAGKHMLPPGPVRLQIPAELQAAAQLQLSDKKTGKPTPIQLEPPAAGSPRRSAVFVTQSALQPGQTRQFTLSAHTADSKSAAPAQMRIAEKNGALTALKRDAAVLCYHTAMRQPPAGVAANYRSSGHIHPVFAPDGQAVTSEFPADHLHQHALFGAWVKTRFKGRKIDFWNQHKTMGRVDHHRVAAKPVQGDAFCQFTTIRRHIAVDVTPPETVLEEQWQVRVYNTPGYQLFDIESRQRLPAGATEPLHIDKYHYGGMALRGRDNWLPQQMRMLTDAGYDRLKGNGKPAKWVTMHGKLKDGAGGITMLSHSGNFNAPQPVRLHPSMPYFCFMPAVNQPFSIGRDNPLLSRYRYCVFNGEINTALLNALSQQFEEKPEYQVTVTAAGGAPSGR